MIERYKQWRFVLILVLMMSACKQNNSTSDHDGKSIEKIKYQKIQIDGMCYDWTNIEPIATGLQAIASLRVAHDSEYLYFCIQGNGLGPHFDLFLDSDNNAATGYKSAQWSKTGCDYLIENGFLYKATGTAWNWANKGSDNILFAANSDVVEMRIARYLLAGMADTIGIGFWDVNSAWSPESILPVSGELPKYVMANGYDISNPAVVPKVLIPAYFDPNSDWERMALQANAMPERVFVIANPSNGPGSQLNTRYTKVIDAIRLNKGRVLGYIYSEYGKRNIAAIKTDIDTWFDFYSIDGIFIDEQAYAAGSELFYRELYDYIKAIKPSALVVGNPGVETLESYLYFNNKPVTDVICIYEDEPNFSWNPPAWTQNYSSAHFCALALQNSVDYKKMIDHAYVNNIGWVYSTDDLLPNPWDTLPKYFEDFCDYLVDK